MLKNVTVFTVCNVAYLDKVFALADSLYASNKSYLDVVIFDKSREISKKSDYVRLHWIEELDIPDFAQLSFKYNVIELTTAMKPWLAKKFLTISDCVIFLDPDTYVFGDFNSVVEDLNSNQVLLTPHYFIPKNDGLIDDCQLLRFGVYNLGFFAVRRSEEANMFLSWWSDRNLENAFDDTAFGVFTDQKWVSLAPIFFPFVSVSDDIGLNVAFWNLNERVIESKGTNEYVINGSKSLVFFHFSAFDFKCKRKLSKRVFDMGQNSISVIGDISEKYANHVEIYKDSFLDKTYSYDYFDNGEYITPLLRRAFECMKDNFDDPDPFCSRSQVYAFGRTNGLIKEKMPFKPESYSDLPRRAKVINVSFYILRLILKIIGPNNFMNLGRFMIYVSRFHHNKKLWKLPKK